MYTLTIHFKDGDRDYAVLREGFTLSDLVGAKGKHATQSLSCQIRSREAALAFLMARDELIRAELKDGSGVVFEGVVRPYRNFSARGNREDNLSLEVLDYTEMMHSYASEAIIYKAQSVKHIFTDVYNLCGIPSELVIPAALESISVDYCICKKGEYFDAWLSQMLFEYGYDFRFSVGRCEIIPTAADGSDQSIDDIRNTLSVSRSDDRNDGVRIRYSNYPSKRMRIADHRSIEFRLPLSWNQFTVNQRKSGYYYNNQMNEESRATEKWLKWFPSGISASDIVGISDVRYDWYIDQPDYLQVGPRDWLNLVGTYDYDLTGAAVSIQYDAQFNTGRWQGGWQFVITADANVRYRVDNAEETYTEGDSPNVVSTQFITTKEMAEALAQREYARLAQASVTYSFTSLTWYEAGKFYNLSDSVTGISTLVRVLSCDMNADGIFTIKAEGAGEIGAAVETKTLRLADLTEASNEFMVLTVDDDELEVGESARVEVSGEILELQDEYGFTYKWYLNNTEIEGESGTALSIPSGRLNGGRNEVRCDSLYNGEVHASASAFITNLAVSETEIEYAVGNSPDNPPLGEMLWEGAQMTWEDEPMSWDDGVWSIEAPTPERGQYLWMRTRRA